MRDRNAVAPRAKSDAVDRTAVGIATTAFFGWLAVLATLRITDAAFRDYSLFLGCNVAISVVLTYSIAELAGSRLLRSTLGAIAFSAFFLTIAAVATY